MPEKWRDKRTRRCGFAHLGAETLGPVIKVRGDDLPRRGRPVPVVGPLPASSGLSVLEWPFLAARPNPSRHECRSSWSIDSRTALRQKASLTGRSFGLVVRPRRNADRGGIHG
ncbi:hypothetical protein GCM10023178_12200 [Actinomadura luteofluorescens]